MGIRTEGKGIKEWLGYQDGRPDNDEKKQKKAIGKVKVSVAP